MCPATLPSVATIGRQPVRDYLEQHGGVLRSDTGFGITLEMANELGYKQDSLRTLLGRMAADGEIVWEKRGKRTYRIELVRDPNEPVHRAQTILALVTERRKLQERLAEIDQRLRDAGWTE